MYRYDNIIKKTTRVTPRDFKEFVCVCRDFRMRFRNYRTTDDNNNNSNITIVDHNDNNCDSYCTNQVGRYKKAVLFDDTKRFLL